MEQRAGNPTSGYERTISLDVYRLHQRQLQQNHYAPQAQSQQIYASTRQPSYLIPQYPQYPTNQPLTFTATSYSEQPTFTASHLDYRLQTTPQVTRQTAPNQVVTATVEDLKHLHFFVSNNDNDWADDALRYFPDGSFFIRASQTGGENVFSLVTKLPEKDFPQRIHRFKTKIGINKATNTLYISSTEEPKKTILLSNIRPLHQGYIPISENTLKSFLETIKNRLTPMSFETAHQFLIKQFKGDLLNCNKERALRLYYNRDREIENLGISGFSIISENSKLFLIRPLEQSPHRRLLMFNHSADATEILLFQIDGRYYAAKASDPKGSLAEWSDFFSGTHLGKAFFTPGILKPLTLEKIKRNFAFIVGLTSEEICAALGSQKEKSCAFFILSESDQVYFAKKSEGEVYIKKVTILIDSKNSEFYLQDEERKTYLLDEMISSSSLFGLLTKEEAFNSSKKVVNFEEAASLMQKSDQYSKIFMMSEMYGRPINDVNEVINLFRSASFAANTFIFCLVIDEKTKEKNIYLIKKCDQYHIVEMKIKLIHRTFDHEIFIDFGSYQNSLSDFMKRTPWESALTPLSKEQLFDNRTL